MSEAVIQTEQLTKCYGSFLFRKKKPSLDSLSISIPEGAVYGFLGPNGAGKTTTIKMLMDLIRPTAGTASVLGKPTWDVPVKKQIGFLPDTPAFNGLMSASEFLTVCARLLGMGWTERRERVKEVLETVQMTPHAKEKLAGFSRGMLQRIGVAQALLNKPKLLILDEPLLGLDPYGRQDFKNIILNQNKQGTTVFFSSHILSDVQEICDNVAILNKGRLLCNGKLSDILGAAQNVVTIRNADECMKELVDSSTECQRRKDGAWELKFNADMPDLEKRLKAMQEKYPGCLEYAEEKESLEEFFFQTVEKDNQKRQERE